MIPCHLRAVYRGRDDGDYDFVAVFDRDQDETFLTDNTSAVDDLKTKLEAAGEEAIILEFTHFRDLVDVWEGPNSQTRENRVAA